MNETILFARQPIFDRSCKMVASEILYRGDIFNSDSDDKDLIATRDLLVNVCTSVFNSNINLDLPMLVNVDMGFLDSDYFFPIPPHNLIFEILETVEPSEDVLKRIAELRRLGYQFALDDYVLEPSKFPFFKHIKILKIDILDIDFNKLTVIFPKLKKVGFQLLAEKVEDQESFDKCLDLGFDLFQGYFLEKPVLISGQKIDANKNSALQLVSHLSRHDIETDEVAELISRDPVLTVKILALINCPIYQLVREVKSVKDAVVRLGLNVVKQWAMILTLASNSSQPKELLRTLLIRAKTLSLFSDNPLTGGVKTDSSESFLVGLLSGIDAVFQVEIKDLLDSLTLSDSIKSALLFHDNDLGKLLQNTIGIERLDDKVFERLTKQELELFKKCYSQALTWTDEVMNYLV
ncbi:HDOD domain-containing protein [Aliiglaciecola sp. 3_MG-2023]|uniref:EAL and HDOD domain-containing protein n=1 Tax=Aliiglaciecola sp. 3_MG-2023 TaxID=3062644 RepID=UPI0026E289BA|nr:HDOD domain-containing protein [Aliiglaciecola sp. 3_MG-2023]MDO6693576.1 HDOD domain-containing protein [Aliiglaciecola sp. 3_MG-2023]